MLAENPITVDVMLKNIRLDQAHWLLKKLVYLGDDCFLTKAVVRGQEVMLCMNNDMSEIVDSDLCFRDVFADKDLLGTDDIINLYKNKLSGTFSDGVFKFSMTKLREDPILGIHLDSILAKKYLSEKISKQ